MTEGLGDTGFRFKSVATWLVGFVCGVLIGAILGMMIAGVA